MTRLGRFFTFLLFLLISALFVYYQYNAKGFYEFFVLFKGVKTYEEYLAYFELVGILFTTICLLFAIFLKGFKYVASLGVLLTVAGIILKLDDYVDTCNNLLGFTMLPISVAFVGALVLILLTFFITLLGILRGKTFNKIIFVASLILFAGFAVLYSLEHRNNLIGSVKNDYYYIGIYALGIVSAVGGLCYRNTLKNKKEE